MEFKQYFNVYDESGDVEVILILLSVSWPCALGFLRVGFPSSQQLGVL